jgi:pyruvate/2-oxoglutarate dehydrogenase complex dihydrolipoamide dehydrogenase (E3) component
MMDVDFLPRHLIIVGGSYVGSNSANVPPVGGRVTIIEMARLVRHEDEDVSAIKDIVERGVSRSG